MSLEVLVLTFVPLFVATDPVGLVPFYLGVTSGKDARARRRVLFGAVVTALVVGAAFLFGGKVVLDLLGVTVADFQVAGGLLLLVLSIKDIASREKTASIASDSAGAVPLGVPLIAGPAVLTSLVMLSDAHGYLPCLVSFVANLTIVALFFWQSTKLMRVLGKAVAGAVSKVASLVLAAYAVMMMRQGLLAVFPGLG